METEAAKKELEQVLSDLAKAKKDKDGVLGAINSGKSELAELNARVEAARKAAEDAMASRKDAEGALKKYTEERIEAQGACEQAEKELASMVQRIEIAREEEKKAKIDLDLAITARRTELGSIGAQVALAKNDAEDTLENLLKGVQEKSTELKLLTDQEGGKHAAIEELDAKIEAKKRELDMIANDLVVAENRIKELAEKEMASVDLLTRLVSENDEVLAKIKAAKEEEAGARASLDAVKQGQKEEEEKLNGMIAFRIQLAERERSIAEREDYLKAKYKLAGIPW